MAVCTLLIGVFAALLIALPSQASAKGGMQLGFAEPRFNSVNATTRDMWHDLAADAGSQWARIGIGWAGIAPNPPANPTLPGSAGYAWAGPDAAIKDAVSRGQNVLLTVSSAPRWAEGPGRPASADPGTWKPNPTRFREFAAALSRRYNGTFKDPNGPGNLPKVSDFEAWNENNLSAFLAPQREGGKTVSDKYYIDMLNGFYDGAHVGQPDANVVAGSLSPIGTKQGSDGRTRTGPLKFLREMFCLKKKGKKYKTFKCDNAIPRFDTLSHHPINVDRKPLAKAGGDDAGIAEMGEIVKILRAAEKNRRALGAKKHPVWNTEFWWHSRPPKNGKKIPSLAQQANYIQEALYILWKDGVELSLLYQVGDQATLPFQSGIYFENGKAKPSKTAFTFPLVGDRKSKKKVKVWGRAPDKGKVTIQVKGGKGGFKTVAKKKINRYQVFTQNIKLKGKGKIRAKIGKEKSLTWKQGKK